MSSGGSKLDRVFHSALQCSSMRDKPATSLSSVDNALRLIEMLRDQGRVRVSDAARELGVARSTAHRLLAMLAYRNFAEQDEGRGYLPGPALSTPQGDGASLHQQFRRRLLPHMEALCEQAGETVNLVVRVGTQSRFLASVESDQVLRIGGRQGVVLPASRSSGGKALLAELTDDELRQLYRPGAVGTDGAESLAEPAFQDLLRDLATVRRRGYALNLEATEPGVSAIGRVVRARALRTVGAVTISVPSARMPRTRIPELADALRDTTDRASAELSD